MSNRPEDIPITLGTIVGVLLQDAKARRDKARRESRYAMTMRQTTGLDALEYIATAFDDLAMRLLDAAGVPLSEQTAMIERAGRKVGGG